MIDRAAFLNPPVSVRPGVRWWWPGGDVDDVELGRELAIMRAAGFGSAEIQSFAVGLPNNRPSAVNTYGTAAWFDHVDAALARAEALGMSIDLTLGSAWPTGGAQVTRDQSLQQLTVAGAHVVGPGTLSLDFPLPAAPIRYSVAQNLLKLPATFDASAMTPVALFAVKLAATQGGSTDTPSAISGVPALPATVYLDPAAVVDLGSYLRSGRIEWPIPDGSWVVFSFYQGPTGSQTFYGADPAPGLVLDHLNKDAVDAFLQQFAQSAATRFGRRFGTTLRSLFVDSPELRTELYWTPDLLAEFAARRGYRLEPFLPILFRPFHDDAYLRNLYPDAPPQFDMADVGPRVRFDFDRTISDLMVERYFRPIAAWAADHGIASRIQAHGSPADLLNAYRTASVPETEGLYAGGRLSFLKLAASAAHVNGAPLVSSEVLAVRGADATPGQMLRDVFRQLAAGVNHVVLHGFPYVYKSGFTGAGWMPFNSPYLPAQNVIGTFGTRLNHTSPFWRFMSQVNTQIARAQLAMRMGQPVADLAVYSDRIGYPDDARFEPDVTRQLERSGQSYDYVNADLLGPATVVDRTLRIGPNVYRALIIDRVTSMPVDVAGRIAELARSGLPVVFIGDVPFQSAGYLQWQQNDAIVRAFFEQLFGQSREALKTESQVLSGSALFLNDVTSLGVALAATLGLTPDVILGDERDRIQFAHRRTSEADYYFVTGSGDSPFSTLVSFAARPGQVPQLFDIPTGKVANAPVYSVQGDRIVLPMQLDPGSAVLVGFERPAGNPPPHVDATDVPFLSHGTDGTLVGSVRYPGIYQVVMDGQPVAVQIGGPSLPAIDLPIWDLVTLSETGNGQPIAQGFPGILLNDLSLVPQLKGFVGTAVYRTLVNVEPAYFGPGVRILLNLGRVHDVADIKINDRGLPSIVAGQFSADIRDYLVPGLNRIEVGVTVGGAPAGLIGPATLLPLYQMALDRITPAQVNPLPFTTVVTPPNFPDSSNDDMIESIRKAAQVTNHVNFQWFWKTPPSAGFPEGGAVVGCQQVGPWVAEAKRLGLGVTLQFQTFVTQLVAANLPPNVRIANPILPFDSASFADTTLQNAYIAEITCLAGLQPDYLVLGPEMNFVVSYNFPEFERYRPVYRKAYDIVKSISPWTQVGLSWQYDGLRQSLPFDTWGYIPAAGPQDFIGLTTYFGYSDDRFREFPTSADIPADYYRPIRLKLGQNIPILFSEIGYSSAFPHGHTTQAQFLRRLPALLNEVRPVSVAWALLHDVNYFVGPSGSLNQSGMLLTNGSPKPVWDAALEMKAAGTLTNVVPQIFAPPPLPFSVTAGPPFFPTTFSPALGFQAIATASGLSGHVSLQFAWKDLVTGQVWGCEQITPYVNEAKRLGLRFTIQFNTYAVQVPSSPEQQPGVVLLNPIHPPNESDIQPSMAMTDIRDAYVREVGCLAELEPDYLVLGPEVNFLVADRPVEWSLFAGAYQAAYAAAKAASPHTQIGVSYQYDGIRERLFIGDLPWYIPLLGTQDFLGLTSYFGYTDELIAAYPFATDVPHDYFEPARLLFPATPIVFTEIGWSWYYPNGRENQALFLNRLPTLMRSVQPANVIWPLQHDVLGYFPGAIAPTNHMGLRQYDGNPKPAWDQAVKLKTKGLYVTPKPIK